MPAGDSAGEAGLAPRLMRRIRITLAYDGGGFPRLAGAARPGDHSRDARRDRFRHRRQAGARGRVGPHRCRRARAARRWPPSASRTRSRSPTCAAPSTACCRPPSACCSAEEVDAAFHPRFDAKAKTYEYRIARGDACSPFDWPFVHHYPYPLDEDRMTRLAGVFEGEHDFTAFAASDDRDAEGQSKVRTIFSSVLKRDQDRLIYRVRGSGFLEAHGAEPGGDADRSRPRQHRRYRVSAGVRRHGPGQGAFSSGRGILREGEETEDRSQNWKAGMCGALSSDRRLPSSVS